MIFISVGCEINDSTNRNQRGLFIIDNTVISADTSTVNFTFSYHYENCIGSWRFIHVWTNKDVRTDPTIIKYYFNGLYNDTSKIFQSSKEVFNNKLNDSIWVIYRFRGEFYDSLSSGLQVNSKFDITDSMKVKVTN